MIRRRDARKALGFSLIELLIVLTVLAVITTVVALLFNRGNSAYRHGETHIEMQRYGRLLTERMTPFMSSIFSPVPYERAVLRPSPDPNVSTDFVYFRSTEDWLNVNYPSPTTSSLEVASPSAMLGFEFYYRIRKNADGDVVLEKMSSNDPDAAAVQQTRVLLRKKPDETLSDLRFTQPQANLVVLEFETSRQTRGDANQLMTVTEDFRVTFNIPSKLI